MAIGILFGLLIPIVTIVAVFTFVAIASWSDSRRKERETYYRHETYRKMLESPGQSADAVLELMREEQRRDAIRRIEGLKLGGMITLVSGIGVMVFLYQFIEEEGLYWVGVIPLLIGLVLMIQGFFLASRDEGTEGEGSGPSR